MNETDSRAVNDGVVVAGADHGQIVGLLRKVLEQIRDLQTGLTVSFEHSPSAHELGLVRFDLSESGFSLQEAFRKELPIKLVQGGFRIKRVNLTRAPLQKNEYHLPGFAGEVAQLRCQWTREFCGMAPCQGASV